MRPARAPVDRGRGYLLGRTHGMRTGLIIGSLLGVAIGISGLLIYALATA